MAFRRCVDERRWKSGYRGGVGWRVVYKRGAYIVDERCWKSAFRGGVGWKVAYRRGAYR